MTTQVHHPQVSISPEEDARLPIYEAMIETMWMNHAPKMYKELKKSGKLQQVIHERAVSCVTVLHQYQDAGMNPDQGRKAAEDLIMRQPESPSKKLADD